MQPARVLLTSIVCVVVGWLGVVGCGDNHPGTGPGTGSNTPTLQSIAIAPNPASVAIGATVKLTATGTFSDQTTQDMSTSVTWTTSSAADATVDASGTVTGVAVGNATITATSGSTSATTTVNVTGAAGNKTITKLTISPVGPSVVVGQTSQLTAMATFSDQSSEDVSTTATWSSSTLSAATVDAKGLVTGVAAGTATITAMFDGMSDSTAVTVNVTGPHVLVSIVVTPANPTVVAGKTLQLTATGKFADGTTEDVTDTAIWMADPTDAASVGGATGLVTAHKAGTSVITATIPVSTPVGTTVVGTTTVTVTETTPVLTSIAITPSPATTAIGQALQLVATGTFDVGPTQDITKTVTWKSAAAATATVDANGVVTGAAAGSTTISATMGTITASTALTVTTAAVRSIAVTPGTVVLAGSATQQYTAVATLTDNTNQDVTKLVKWAASNVNVATIVTKGANIGLATTVAVGTATITAALNGISGTATITVSPPTVSSTSPADGETDVNTSQISVTFDQAVLPTSLTTQTADGPCTGTVQLSKDNFTTCVGFTATQPPFQGNTASPGVRNALDVNTTYKIRVTDFVSGVTNTVHGVPFTQATGFTTAP